MKNVAKLTLFFSLNFAILFLAGVFLGLLSSWIELARFIPLEIRPGENLASLTWKALPVALYLSVLLTLSYTARRNVGIPFAIFGILVLACIFTFGLSLGINSLATSRNGEPNPVFGSTSSIRAEPGLVLSRSDNTIVLLRGSADIRGPRVVAIPGQPLIYHETPLGPNNTILSLPALPFADNTPWFVRSLAIDFSLSAGELRGRLESSFLFFAVYAFALILLLVSLRFLLEWSRWPLANLFLGALVFRGIVALETFLNAGEINELLASFLGGRLPSMLITPAVFGALAVLFIFYTLLVRLARPRRSEDD